MNKILLYTFLLLFILSCKKASEPVKIEYNVTKLSQALTPILSKEININNDLVEARVENELSLKYLELVKKDNFLDDYPVFFETGIPAGNGNSWVKLRTAVFPTEEDSIKGLYKDYKKFSFQLVGKMKSNEAENLKKGTPYLVKGKMVEKGWQGTNLYYDFFTKILDGNVDFGNITYDIKSIKPQ
ncbi:hypothetical protein CMU68_10480 [Elizabethkingia anophelis]|nr:hypothetical protein [Elizabethkingia anophelis]MDV3678787.1 hypothetical protein [Elizabethkingia anophelis]